MIYKYHLLLYTTIVLFVVTGCKKESLPQFEINSDNVTLHYDETFQFSIMQENQVIPSSSVQWASADEMTGIVDPSGLFKAGVIGTAIVTGTYDGQIVTSEVTVVPRHEFFREPLTIMGSSMQTVKDYEMRSFLEFIGYDDRLDYVDEDAYILDLAYIFADDKLRQIFITFVRTPDLYEHVIDFYKERYIYERTINQRLVFVDRDKTLRIMVEANRFAFPQPTSIEVVYLPYSPRYTW